MPERVGVPSAGMGSSQAPKGAASSCCGSGVCWPLNPRHEWKAEMKRRRIFILIRSENCVGKR